MQILIFMFPKINSGLKADFLAMNSVKSGHTAWSFMGQIGRIIVLSKEKLPSE